MTTKYKQTKSFIYKSFQKIKGKLVLLHGRLSNIDEESLKIEEIRNAYQILFDWIVSVLQYGLILSIIISYFISITFPKFIFGIISLGLLHWLCFDTIKKIKENIK